jgi:hypothetical protein
MSTAHNCVGKRPRGLPKVDVFWGALETGQAGATLWPLRSTLLIASFLRRFAYPPRLAPIWRPRRRPAWLSYRGNARQVRPRRP